MKNLVKIIMLVSSVFMVNMSYAADAYECIIEALDTGKSVIPLKKNDDASFEAVYGYPDLLIDGDGMWEYHKKGNYFTNSDVKGSKFTAVIDNKHKLKRAKVRIDGVGVAHARCKMK